MLYGQLAPGDLINMVTKKSTSTSLLALSADTNHNGSLALCSMSVGK